MGRIDPSVAPVQPLPQFTGLLVGGGVNCLVGADVVGLMLGCTDVDGARDVVGSEEGACEGSPLGSCDDVGDMVGMLKSIGVLIKSTAHHMMPRIH